MKVIQHILGILLIASAIVEVSSFSLADDLGSTFVAEDVVPFDLPIRDLETTSKNQLSRNDFKTINFTTDHVEVTKLVYKTIYNGSGRIVDPS